MAEYIEREALLKAYLDFSLAKSKAAKARKGVAFFQGELYPMIEITEKEWIRLINAAPAADVAPMVHGRWERVTTKFFAAQTARVGYCQNCNEERFVDNFCPNCGAKMDLEGGKDG